MRGGVDLGEQDLPKGYNRIHPTSGTASSITYPE